MPVEDFMKCTGSKKRKLFNKILETVTKFTKRISVHNFLLSEIKQNKKCLSTLNLTRSKSHDNLDFLRPYDYFDNRKFNSQEHSNKWEILSQITHTPQSCAKLGLIEQTGSDNKQLNRHKSMNDLMLFSGKNRSSKQLDKLNGLLDFVMSQMLDSPYKDSDKLLKSIQDLIIESGVQIVLQSIHELNESLYQKNMVGNSNYLRVICSPETSSSESDTLIRPNWLNKDYEQDISSNSLNNIPKENYNIRKMSRNPNSNIVCIPNAHTEKAIRSRANMKNIMSPTFRESIAFKYNSKSKPSSKKVVKTQNPTKDQKVNLNGDKKLNGEYSCYITARKASGYPNSKSKSNPNISVYNTKCSLENNHAVNLSPIPENKSIDKLQNCNRTVLSKPTIDGCSLTTCLHASNNNKSKKCPQQSNQHRRIVKNNNNHDDKGVKKESNIVAKTPSKPQSLKFSTENLQITKASSVDCLSTNDREKQLENKTCNKALNFKCNNKFSTEKKLKIAPIKFVFAGEKNSLVDSRKLFDNNSVKKLKSVVSNFKYFHDDVNNSKTVFPTTEAVSLKSKTTFGINTGYINYGKQILQVSNYNSKSIVKEPIEMSVGICDKKSNPISDWSDYIQKLELENNIYSNKISYDSAKSPELLNVTTISMVNNNNDRADLEISETEQPNTDSSCTFHAVRAKYFKEYFPMNCEPKLNETENISKPVEDESKLASINEFTELFSIDPNPEVIRNIYDKVRSTSNIKQISIGQTYSCDENNDLLLCNTSSFINSQSFATKYNTSIEDEEDVQNHFNSSDSTFDKNQFNNSTEFLNENSISLNIKPKIKEILKKKLKKICSVIKTSSVDIVPALDGNSLSCHSSEIDNNSDIQVPSVNVVYCRNPVDKRSTKRFQKNIPENLLKHTFASQQKIRLKHE